MTHFSEKEKQRQLMRAANWLAKDSQLTIKEAADRAGWKADVRGFRQAYQESFGVYPTEHRRWLSTQAKVNGDKHTPKGITAWIEAVTWSDIRVARIGSVTHKDVIDVIVPQEVFIYYQGQRLTLHRVSLAHNLFERVLGNTKHRVVVSINSKEERVRVKYTRNGEHTKERVRICLFVGMNLKLKRETVSSEGLITHYPRGTIFYIPKQGSMCLFEIKDILSGGVRHVRRVDGSWEALLEYSGKVTSVINDDEGLYIKYIDEEITKIPSLRVLWRDYLNDPEYKELLEREDHYV